MPPRPVSPSSPRARPKPDPHPPFPGAQRVGPALPAEQPAQGSADRPARFLRLLHRRDHLPRARHARSSPGASRAKSIAATTARFPPRSSPISTGPTSSSRSARRRPSPSAASCSTGWRKIPRTPPTPRRAAACAWRGKSSRASIRWRRACRSTCASIRRSSRKARAISSRCAASATRRPTGPSFSPPTTRCCCAGSAISCRCCSPTRTRSPARSCTTTAACSRG